MNTTTEMDYYEDIKYQEFLLSSKRRAICPPEPIIDLIDFKHVNNVIDFGMGLGFFTPYILKKLNPDTSWLWGVECQQELIDLVLKRKITEGFERFSVFYMDKNEHPLLPEWVPVPEVIFTSMCLSTFADPGQVMDGLIRSMKKDGRLYVVDWAKVESPVGPVLKDKVSQDKMKYLAEFYKLEVVNTFKINEYVYAMEIKAGPGFVYGFYGNRE